MSGIEEIKNPVRTRGIPRQQVSSKGMMDEACTKAVQVQQSRPFQGGFSCLPHASVSPSFFSLRFFPTLRRYAILFIKTPVPLPCRQLCTCSPELHAMLVGPWSKECTQGGDMRRGGGDKAPACTNPKSSAKKKGKKQHLSLSLTQPYFNAHAPAVHTAIE